MFKLDITYDDAFELMGIACHRPDYQLCWAINRALKWNLAWTEDVAMHTARGEMHFARFCHSEEDGSMHIDIVTNRMAGSYLVPEYPQVDFIVKYSSEIEAETGALTNALRKAEGVMGVFKLNKEKIKHLDYLIFE